MKASTKSFFRILFGGAAMVSGWFMLLVIISATFSTLMAEGLGSLRTVTIVPVFRSLLWILSSAAALALGLRLLRPAGESVLKGIAVILALMLWMYCNSWLGFILMRHYHTEADSLLDRLHFLLSTLIGFVCYVLWARFLFVKLKKRWESFRFFLNRGMFILLALQIWILMLFVFEEHMPDLDEPNGFPLMGMVSVLLPMGTAYLIYKIAVKTFIQIPDNG